MGNAPMNSSRHVLDRIRTIGRVAKRAEGADARGERARAKSAKIKPGVRGGTKLVLGIRAGCCLGSERIR
jgi:hypothetical protein